jgi:ribosomal-protein-alanine N-acetyltransferase
MMGLFPRVRVFIADLGPADAEAMAEIHGEAFVRAWSGDDFAALMDSDNVFALGLKRESLFGPRRLQGFVIVRKAADEGEILTVAVRAASRGRGYGRLLMEEALRRLYRDRVAACFLEVDRGNAAAVALYGRLGFLNVGERKGYYRDPATSSDGTALVMRAQVR